MSINSDVVDRFTIAHFGVGGALGALDVPFLAAAAAAIGWELLEVKLKESMPEVFPHPSQDSIPNATADVLAWCAGWWFIQKVWAA